MSTTVLAGDVGGTKTLLGLYEVGASVPAARAVQRFTTLDFGSLTEIVEAFVAAAGWRGRIDAACFGVAGPVRSGTARLTHVPWLVTADGLAQRFAIDRVRLLNDLAAMAHAVPALDAGQLEVLQRGDPDPDGNAALIAPGTDLGEALLHRVGGRFVPAATEAAHADFAARSPREVELLRALTARFGRARYGHVLSGPGLANIHDVVHGAPHCAAVPADTDAAERPALISQAGAGAACPGCVETLALFTSALGAEAGNLGLRSTATAGVYLGGGIPAKILPALRQPAFLDAFRAKAPMHALVENMPVAVILEPRAALLGAARAAAELLADADAA